MPAPTNLRHYRGGRWVDLPPAARETTPPPPRLSTGPALPHPGRTMTRPAVTLILATAVTAAAGGFAGQPPPSGDIVLVLKGHTDTVEAVAVSPDGNRIATAGFDGTVRLFEAATGAEVRRYAGEAGHKGQVLAVAFSARGDQLATGGADNTARVWDVPVEVPQKTYPTTAAATRLAVSPADGKTFAVAQSDGAVKVFPAGEEKGAVELKGHAGAVTHLARAGATWVTVGADGTVRQWADDGKAVSARFAGTAVTGVAAAPNGAALYTATADGRVVVWNLPPAAVVPNAVPAVGSGTTFALFDAALKKGNPVPAVPAREWVAGAGRVGGLVLAPDGGRVLTVGPGKECAQWNAANGQKERAYETGGDATAAAYAKDGQRVAVAGADGTVRLYLAADGKLSGSFPAGGPVSELAFHPTLPLLVGTVKNAATVWTVAQQPGQPAPPEFGRVVQAFPHPKGVASPTFTADGQFLTAGADNTVRRFRIASDAPVKTFAHPNLVDSVAFDDTGNVLATGCHDGSLRLWDLPKNAASKTIAAHVATMPQTVQHPIYAVAWSPDFKQVFTASYDKSIKLWDVASGNLVREFKAAPDPRPEPKVEEPKKDDKKDEPKKDPPKKDEPKKEEPKKDPGPPGHRDQVFSVAVSKDGKFLASGSSDRSVKVWDVATGAVVRDFANPDFKPVLPGEPAPSHPGWVHAVRFTPDGAFVVSGGAVGTRKGYLAVWRAADGKRVYGAERDGGPVRSVAVTPDGTRLVLGCAAAKGKPEAEVVVIKLPGK
ncbi:MAG: hypothetical protein C0501_30220 [Isosphaera sp.]|nr:hypothetical protein [Isosphaera sp.]